MREQQQQNYHKNALRLLLLCVGLAVSVLLSRVGQEVVLRQQPPQKEDTDEPQSHYYNDRHLLRQDQEDAFIEELRERMKPRDLKMHPENPNDDSSRYIADPHQFFHLHHMKTGGTSINRVIHCALDRAKRIMNQDISSYSVSECNPHFYQECLSGKSSSCQKGISTSAIMEYCAPLFQTNVWDWGDADAMTVLRHPVDRVWSMFRFQTKRCYQCRNLTDIYQDMDDDQHSSSFDGDVCLPQLTNHLTRNLLSVSTTATTTTQQQQQHAQLTDEEQIENALDNLRHRFTVVGLTNELNTTANMMGHVFPWLAEYLSNDDHGDDDTDNNDDGDDTMLWSSKENSGYDACPLPHANASPRNTCGPGHTHWELPDHPDEVTRQAILKHNALDLKLYEAAVQHFELQKRALGWNEDVG